MMDRDYLYYHFSNLSLVLIGLLSIRSLLNPFMLLILILGILMGFIVSWQIRNKRPQHIDTFIGMLSLAAVVVLLSRLYDMSITFENLLKILSIALVWLTLFQSYGLKSGNSYAILQFISVSLLISSVGLALEQEFFYTVVLALYLFIFIFTMRLNLICEKKRKGSLVIGNQEEIMSLWQQIKVGAIMFSLVMILSSFVYPLVPRFESLSLKWVPSTILSAFDKLTLLKLLKQAPLTIKENQKSKEDRFVDDELKKRELDSVGKRQGDFKEIEKDKEESVKRFPSKEFNKELDILKVESLTISAESNKMEAGSQNKLNAQLKLNDGSIVPATRLVDWKASGTADVAIDKDGILVAKESGYANLSASYMGNFSNDIHIEISSPSAKGGSAKKKGWLSYFATLLLWFVFLVIFIYIVWIFINCRRMSELAAQKPREFIKELYNSLCRAFKIYGTPRFTHIAHREFFDSLKGFLVSSNPEPMQQMTEAVLEARFSIHEITREHSQNTLELFHGVKDIVLQREDYKELWKKILFMALVLDILLLPRKV